jgi:ADP-L-glycero-D-manno-heptose 6-epimerase
MYGYSKHLFDLWLKRERLLDRVAGLKFSNVFGPNEYHKGPMRSMVLKAFHQVQETGVVKLFRSYREKYADGDQMRDFLYVKDAVSFVLFLLDRPQVTGIFNAGSGVARTWNDLATAACRALGRDARIEYIDMPAELRGQYQYFTCLEMDRLARAGYARPTTILEDAIKDYVRNYLARHEHLDYTEPGTVPVEPDATYF